MLNHSVLGGRTLGLTMLQVERGRQLRILCCKGRPIATICLLSVTILPRKKHFELENEVS